jgi:uncharacterized protein YcbK (DUF882 family)
MVYPSDYSKNSTSFDPLIPIDEIPDELVNNVLPLNFVLAKYSGSLICFRDLEGGYVRSGVNARDQSLRRGRQFQSELNLAKKTKDTIVFDPVNDSPQKSNPHIFCKIPRVDQGDALNATWFFEWLTYIEGWQQRATEIETLSSLNSISQQEAAGLEASAKELDSKILLTSQMLGLAIDQNRSLSDQWSQIRQVQAQCRFNGPGCVRMDDIQLNLTNQSQKSEMEQKLQDTTRAKTQHAPAKAPPFELKGSYQFANDPFQRVLKEMMKDVSSKNWVTDQMQSGKYMDPELADQIDKANTILADPSLAKDIFLAADIRSLKKMGFRKILITSGARTPLRQAFLYSEASTNKNPVAKYTGSDHLFGQAADMQIPRGWSWNSKEHKKLRSVLDRLGLSMKVSQDPVHFTLKSPSRDFSVRRILAIRAYLRRAHEIKTTQDSLKENLVFTESKITEQKAQLSSDIEARHKVLKENVGNLVVMTANNIALTEAVAKVEKRKSENYEYMRKRQEEWNQWLIKLANESQKQIENPQAGTSVGASKGGDGDIPGTQGRPGGPRGKGGTDIGDSPIPAPSERPPSDKPPKDPWGGANIGGGGDHTWDP